MYRRYVMIQRLIINNICILRRAVGMILYHGSNNIIKQPFLGGGNI